MVKWIYVDCRTNLVYTSICMIIDNNIMIYTRWSYRGVHEVGIMYSHHTSGFFLLLSSISIKHTAGDAAFLGNVITGRSRWDLCHIQATEYTRLTIWKYRLEGKRDNIKKRTRTHTYKYYIGPRGAVLCICVYSAVGCGRTII